MVVVRGEDVMRDFVRNIMRGSMNMTDEEAEMVVDRVDETLSEGLSEIPPDPRMN